DRDLGSGDELYRPLELADAELRALQVRDQRERPPFLRLDLADETGALGVRVVVAVRHVQARRVHARADERADALERRGRRPDRGADLGAARTLGRHRPSPSDGVAPGTESS